MPPASGNSDVSPLMAQMMQEKFPPNGTRWTDDLRVKDDKDLTSSARDRKYPNANRQWSDEDNDLLWQFRETTRSSPYAQVAEFFGKTPLACRLHWHQLKKGRPENAEGDRSGPPPTSDEAAVAETPRPAPNSGRTRQHPSTTMPPPPRRIVPRDDNTLPPENGHLPEDYPTPEASPGTRSDGPGSCSCSRRNSAHFSAFYSSQRYSESVTRASPPHRYATFRHANGQRLESLRGDYPTMAYPVPTSSTARQFAPRSMTNGGNTREEFAAVHALADMALSERSRVPVAMPAAPARDAVFSSIPSDPYHFASRRPPALASAIPARNPTTSAAATAYENHVSIFSQRAQASNPAMPAGNRTAATLARGHAYTSQRAPRDSIAEASRRTSSVGMPASRNNSARMSIASIMNNDEEDDNVPTRGTKRTRTRDTPSPDTDKPSRGSKSCKR